MTSAYDQGSCPTVEVYHRMRIARQHAGLEQGDLAERIGVSRNTISNAENNRVQPRRLLINAWALACGVPVSWILTGQTPAPPDDIKLRSSDYKNGLRPIKSAKVGTLRSAG